MAVAFLLTLLRVPAAAQPATEEDYYRIVTISTSEAPTDSRAKLWKPAPNSLPLEVSGIAVLDDQQLAVSIRKGEVWILDRVYDDPPSRVEYRKFAEGLHEPLGLIRDKDSFLTAQRSELTRLVDRDRDGNCDEYITVAKGWGVTGNYHEYAYGPRRDGNGDLWVTLNIGMGLDAAQKERTVENKDPGFAQSLWRGWGMKVTAQGELLPMCSGMRSPSGLGANLAGELFYTDQQGNWVATNTLHHLRAGAFYHYPDSGSPADGLPIPEALARLPQMRPPAVWLPYKKVGQSPTDVRVDGSAGKFGPFAGQLFIGEFTLAGINRVFLERVDGEYQGACFPFRSGFASAVIRLEQGTDGSLFAGLSNRGWSSLGGAAYGLQRLVWTGKMPFEIQEVRAQSDGFEVRFTMPVTHDSAIDPRSYAITSHTYIYHARYGSDEIAEKKLKIEQVTVSEDRQRVKLKVSPLRPFFVHSLTMDGIRNEEGEPLLHPQAHYTLNRIPK
jgi:hypothetical protein